ncbi:MAG TPA: zinc ABC transporter substrate-binding protein [Methanoculleus sp.]|nr:zinc ABC transporter substrate-binding protein [Methanoculleus sp.]HRR88688.1 zinc ABC transporter substrate-binding protein [Methanoculleus sp.]
MMLDTTGIKPLSLVAVACLLLGLMTAMAGCTGADGDVEDDGRIAVVVTIPPQQEFVERVGGDHVRVILLVPPGADPHTYEPAPAVLAAVAEADLYAMVGSGIEFEIAWGEKIAALNPDMTVVNCSQGVEFIAADPHIWTSPRNAKVMVENIRDGLIEADPENAEDYRRNAAAYLDDLDALDAEISALIAGSGVRVVLVDHPSWAYLARDYGFEEVAIESEGKEPSPKRIEHLIRLAEEEGVRVVFASPEHSTRSAGVIAEAIGGSVVTVSPLKKDYLDNMRQVAAAFAGSVSG